MLPGLLCLILSSAGMPELGLIPEDSRPKIEAAQWQEDVRVLDQALVRLHPGRLRYQTEDQYQERLSAMRAYFAQPRSLAQGYLAIAQFLRRLQCGHSYPNFFNQSAALKAELFAGQNKLPFSFRWLGTRMVVTSTGNGVTPGDEVLKIDGVPVDRIQRTLMTVARADGGNDDKRRKWLELTGVDGLEAFDIYHPLFFPLPGPHVRLTLDRGEVEVEAVTLESRLKTAPQNPNPNAPIWTTRLVRPDTTLLEMPSWALYNSRWNWKGWLETFFRDLKTPNLVIDLRENEGGNSVGSKLLSHLTKRTLPANRFATETTYQRVPVWMRPGLSTWDNRFYDWGNAARPRPDGRFDLVRQGDEDEAAIQPSPIHYGGKVAVLMGATNSSATFDFLSSAKGTGLVTLIGQRSGGNQRGINGGGFFFMVLPNSGIEVDVPLIGYFPRGTRPNEGIRPDIQVVPTREAIARGEDQELARALAFFDQGR